MTDLTIEGGRILDPATGRDETGTLSIEGGRIAKAGARGGRVIDARGQWVVPGLIDMHVHLREPGREEDETVATGTAAAVAGGVTSVACMPNTEPALDSPGVLALVRQRAREAGAANVFPTAAVTKGRQGAELVDVGALVEAGAVAFTDDGSPVFNSALMRRALEEAPA